MEISNKTIAVLLIATIAIYLGGTLFSLSQLNKLGLVSITGFTSTNDTGTATLNIGEQVILEFTNATVDWGTGYVAASAPCPSQGCSMAVNGTGEVGGGEFDSTCCKEFYYINDTLLLKNAGNKNLSLELNISKNDTSTTAAENMFTATDSRLFFRFVPTSTRAHVSNDSGADGDTADPCTEWDVTSGDWADWVRDFPAMEFVHVCGRDNADSRNFSHITTKNEVNLDVWVNLSATEDTGGKSVTITARGTST